MEYTIQKYMDAVEAWAKAVDEIDQAHAVLRDLGLHKAVSTGSGPYRVTPDQMLDKANALLDELRTLTCDACGERLVKHGTDCQEWK